MIKPAENRATRFTVILAIYMLIALMVYASLGRLLTRFNADELFLLHFGWFHYVDQNPYQLPHGLFEKLLEIIWSLLDGDLSGAWKLKFVLISFFFLQGLIFFNISGYMIAGNLRKYFTFRLLLCVCFVTVIAAFRGYEIRPEVIANTGLLLGVLTLFRLTKQDLLGKKDWLLIGAANGSMIIASAVSMRHFLLACLMLTSLFYFLYLSKPRWNWFVSVIIATVGFFLYIHVIEFNIFDRVVHADSFQSAQAPATVLKRFSTGGGLVYFIFLVLILILFFAIFLKLQRSQLASEAKSLYYLFCLLIILHIFFLIKFDIRPHEYVRSIEWILIVSTFSSLIAATNRCARAKQAVQMYLPILVIVLVGIVLRAGQLNIVKAPTHAVLGNLLGSQSQSKIKMLSDNDLVKTLVQGESILDQVWSRAEFCERYPGSFIAISKFIHHPVCMHDGDGLPDKRRKVWMQEGFDPKNFVLLSTSESDHQRFSDFGFKHLSNISEINVWIRVPTK